MNTPLLDPLIFDSLVRGGRPLPSGLNFTKFVQNFSPGKFILNLILPLFIFLFIVFFLKLKWDRKRHKNNFDI